MNSDDIIDCYRNDWDGWWAYFCSGRKVGPFKTVQEAIKGARS